MTTGKLPFDGDSAVTVALKQLQSTPKRPREINPGIPIGLEQITMKAMEKMPADRYTSAAEMLSDIERLRLNPSIVFDYGKSFVDDQPTKFVHSLKDAKHENTKLSKKLPIIMTRTMRLTNLRKMSLLNNTSRRLCGKGNTYCNSSSLPYFLCHCAFPGL